MTAELKADPAPRRLPFPDVVHWFQMDKDELIRQALEQFAEAKDEFCQAHEKGTMALRRGDYGAVLQAIAAEFGAIEKQKAATKRLANAADTTHISHT